MALQAVLDTVDSLPDAVRSEYRPGTEEEGLKGKFVLDVTPDPSGWALENVTGLKNSLGNARGERDQLKSKLSGYGDVEPSKVQELQKQLESLQAAGDDAKGKIKAQVESQIAEVKKALEADKTELAKKLEGSEKTIEQLVIDNAARAAILEEGGNPDFLLHHVKDQTKVEWVDKPDGSREPVARVLDPKNRDSGPRITLKTGSTDAMGISELVTLMKSDDRFKPAFKSNAPGGAGSQASTPTQNGSGVDTSKMSPAEKINYGLQHGKTA